MEYEIERQGDVMIICPVGAPLTNVLERFAAFSTDFMTADRPDRGTQVWESLRDRF